VKYTIDIILHINFLFSTRAICSSLWHTLSDASDTNELTGSGHTGVKLYSLTHFF